MPKNNALEIAPAPPGLKGNKRGASRLVISRLVPVIQKLKTGEAVVVDGINRVIASYVAIVMSSVSGTYLVAYIASDGKCYIRRDA